MVRYPSPTLGSLPLPISLRSLSPILAATFMPPRGRPTLVVLSLVTSSSVASFSSASSRGAAACRSLVLAASFAREGKRKKRKETTQGVWYLNSGFKILF